MNLPKFVQTKFTKEQKRISKTKMISNYKKQEKIWKQTLKQEFSETSQKPLLKKYTKVKFKNFIGVTVLSLTKKASLNTKIKIQNNDHCSFHYSNNILQTYNIIIVKLFQW